MTAVQAAPGVGLQSLVQVPHGAPSMERTLVLGVPAVTPCCTKSLKNASSVIASSPLTYQPLPFESSRVYPPCRTPSVPALMNGIVMELSNPTNAVKTFLICQITLRSNT